MEINVIFQYQFWLYYMNQLPSPIKSNMQCEIFCNCTRVKSKILHFVNEISPSEVEWEWVVRRRRYCAFQLTRLSCFAVRCYNKRELNVQRPTLLQFFFSSLTHSLYCDLLLPSIAFTFQRFAEWVCSINF